MHSNHVGMGRVSRCKTWKTIVRLSYTKSTVHTVLYPYTFHFASLTCDCRHRYPPSAKKAGTAGSDMVGMSALATASIGYLTNYPYEMRRKEGTVAVAPLTCCEETGTW